MLAHSGQKFSDTFGETSRFEVVQIIAIFSSEGLTNDAYASIMRISHFTVLFTGDHFHFKGIVHDFFPIKSVSAMNKFEVLPQELSSVVSARSEIDQVKDAFFFIVKIVSWVRISLHQFPLEKFPETQFN